ncbi:MAG: ASPIC/UnbV domain-containing protein [Planctomycetes bacterium]|nr:ASPIC/UnbV domain-containing protein [Planctomycetota bacterium]
MSQGNVPISESNVGAARFYLDLVKQGRTFSGRERHCAFLNTRDNRFAAVGAVSGLDWPDDGRGAARVDWDHDGDLDLWISSRSGPQVRLLRNDLATGHAFLAVRLEGRTCNRDAIGARLELFARADDAVPLVGSVRAGEGFLSQSSKWVHFGLGDAREIDRLVVHWPGGEAETIRGLTPSRQYHIVQGSGRARPWKRPKPATFDATPLSKPASTSVVRLFSHTAVPLPTIKYSRYGGGLTDVFTGSARQPTRPVLLNLWASWCGPCVAELRELADNESRIRAAGLDVVAASIDEIDPKLGGSDAAARRLIGSFDFPFAAGKVGREAVEKLQMANDMILDLHEPLPVPTSVLIDEQGRLAAIYKGRLDVDRMLRDVRRLKLSGEARRRASLPFAGRWFAPPRQLNLYNMALALFDRGFFDEGISFYVENARQLKSHPQHARLLVRIGDGAIERRRFTVAAKMYDEALSTTRGYAEAMRQAARFLATCPEEQFRDGPRAASLARQAIALGDGRDPAALAALSAAQAELGNFEAAGKTAEQAARMATKMGRNELARQLEAWRRLYEQQRPVRIP